MPTQAEVLRRAETVEASFLVSPGIYLIGSFERGLTVYNQQLRAHNLIWALWHLQRNDRLKVGHIAIVGGGIAGLTAAACVLSLFSQGIKQEIKVTLFEELWDLCPFQQGADDRWLHPRIYSWPSDGSRAPSASLPVLNWSEGRAADVANTILREFGRYCDRFAVPNDKLAVILGVGLLQIEATTKIIQWIGNRTVRAGGFFHVDDSEGSTSSFDTIILTAGFGLERCSPEYPTPSYWRNEQLGQPVLDGTQRRYVVSGYGDSALVDLCRLTIERFRQDTIVYELFGDRPETVERQLWEAATAHGLENNVFDLLAENENGILQEAKHALAHRIRKDTSVVLHLSGRRNEIYRFQSIFGESSSFLNRVLAYLLYRCGAFSVSFSDLNATVQRHAAPRGHVLCRHGVDTENHLRRLFVDHHKLAYRFAEMKRTPRQSAKELWMPGCFPQY